MATNDPNTPETILKKLGPAVQSGDIAQAEALTQQLKTAMSAPFDELLSLLEKAIENSNQEQAKDICQRFIDQLRSNDEACPTPVAREFVRLLRRKRYFKLIIKVADILILSGQQDPNVRRQYGQALIDVGQITTGITILHKLKADTSNSDNKEDQREHQEAIGLIGRAHKQAFIDAYRGKETSPLFQQHLIESIKVYGQSYHDTGGIWPGINYVALLKRARRDRINLGKHDADAEKIAEDILSSIEAKENNQSSLTPWDFATAGEAYVAINNWDEALKWIVRYTEACQNTGLEADAFEYASTLRQFEEVWQLDDSIIAQAKILQLLRSSLLQCEGGEVIVTDPQVELQNAATLAGNVQFEKVLGKERYNTFRWYRMGLCRATCVAQILDRFGDPQGTGFLLKGSDLHPTLSEKTVLVTNAHVISDDPAEQDALPKSLPANEARVRFEAHDNPMTEYEVEKILFSSGRQNLDCTVVLIKGAPPIDFPYPIAKHPPLNDGSQRVYAIGHPRGGGLSFSMHDSKLLDIEIPKIHYRTPTEGGSSGSPVFTQAWDLVALHHAGGTEMPKLGGKPGTYPANEGLFFPSIIDAIAQELESTS